MTHRGTEARHEALSVDAVVARDPVLAARFASLGVLGIGGMGIVVAANERATGRPVAIKLLRDAGALPRAAVARMLREARLTATLRSEHVVRILEVGALDTGAPFLVMERLFGVDLAARLRAGPMNASEVVLVVRQACEALAEAHRLGIVHRDLKPSNLFLANSAGGYCTKVLDFGIAREIPDAQSRDLATTSLTESGNVLGSPRYMAPEQVRGRPELDGRADIWALGVILYEALSGASPFRGATLADTFVRIVSESHAPLTHVAPSVPAGLASLVESCLEKERERRPRSVVELARGLALYAGGASPARLESAEAGAPELEETCADFALPPPPLRDRRRPARGRLAMAGTALAAACALAGIAPWLLPPNHARASGPSAPVLTAAAATVVSAPALASADDRVPPAVAPVPAAAAVHAANSPPLAMRAPVLVSSSRPALPRDRAAAPRELPRAPAIVAQPRADGGTPVESASMESSARSGAEDPLRLDIRP